MLQKLISRFQDWSGIGRPGRRKWIFLAIAGVLWVLGQIARNVPALRAMETFAWNMVHDLGNISVLNFLSLYGRLVWCETSDRVGMGVYTTCGWGHVINPISHVVSLPQALWQMLAGAPSDAAFVVYLIAAVTGFALANYIVTRFRGSNEFNLGHLMALALLTAAGTSVVALVMQVAGIVLFAIFGGVIGLVIFAYGDIRVVMDFFKGTQKVHRYATGKGTMADAAADAAGAILGEDTLNPVEAARDIDETATGLEKAANRLTRGKPPPPGTKA